MEFEYEITTNSVAVVKALAETDALLEATFNTDQLITQVPLDNEIVDRLRLVPEKNAATHYSLQHLRKAEWQKHNPNGFENTQFTTVKLAGGLEELEKMAVAPKRFTLGNESFQDFVDNNSGLTAIVDYEKIVSQSECWTPQALSKNPLAPKFELSNNTLHKWEGLSDSLKNLDVDSKELANYIRDGGHAAIHLLEDNIAVKLAYQYSKGNVIEIPSKANDGTQFLNNPHLTELTDSFIEYQNQKKLDGEEPTIDGFYESIENLEDYIDAAVDYQIRMTATKQGIVHTEEGVTKINSGHETYISDLATQLYKQLNPSGVIMGLEYHLKQIAEAYEKKHVPDKESLEVQLNLLMADNNEKLKFQKWIARQLQVTLHRPHAFILGSSGKQPMKTVDGMLHFNRKTFKALSNVPADTMVAALVQTSLQSTDKIKSMIESETTTPSNYVAKAYADLITDFTDAAVQISEQTNTDIELAKQELFLDVAEFLEAGALSADNDYSTELNDAIKRLAVDFRDCPMATPNADPTQTLSLNDIKAIIVPDAEEEHLQIEQILAVERMKSKGFKGEIHVFDSTEKDTKAEAVKSVIRDIDSVVRYTGEPLLPNVEEPHITISEATKILDVIQSQNPYLQLVAHTTHQTMPTAFEARVDMSNIAGMASEGTMHVNLSHDLAQTESTLREIVAHEAVHLGLRKMMNVAEHATLMEQVWGSMTDEHKSEIAERYPFYNAEKVIDRRVLAEEWLASRAQTLDVEIKPIIKESIASKVKAFQDKILGSFVNKGKESQFDAVIKRAIQRAGGYNEIVDGKYEHGVHKKSVRTFAHNNTTIDPLRHFHEGQSSGLGHNSSVRLAAKSDFIHQYEVEGGNRYLNVTFDKIDKHKIEGSTLVLPLDYSLSECLDTLNATIDKSSETKQDLPLKTVSSPKEVKQLLGNIEQQVKSSQTASAASMASVFEPNTNPEPNLKPNNIDNGVDFMSR